MEYLKSRTDIPYDELYHKERTLVDNVVKAQQALNQKRAQLPIAFGEGRVFKPQDFATITNPNPLETQFEQDMKKLSNYISD